MSVNLEGISPAQEAIVTALTCSINLSLAQGLNPGLISSSLKVEGHPIVSELRMFLEDYKSGEVAVEKQMIELTGKGEKQTCGSCGAAQLRQNGTCMLCEVCGETTGCS